MMRDPLQRRMAILRLAAVSVLAASLVLASWQAIAGGDPSVLRVSVNAVPAEAGLLDTLQPPGAGSPTAASPEDPASSPSPAELLDVEPRVLRITENLRCLVCQNQSIADSHADLAMDLKQQVREKLLQGWSDGEIMDFMVQRYGDFVLYRPPVKRSTWLLWFGPLALLVAGLAGLVIRLRGRQAADPDLSAEDQAHARQLLQIAPAGEDRA